jgi:predicted transcriptional regulator
MKSEATIAEDISKRVDALAKRSTLTRAQIIEDALAHGRSLAWQERWVQGVEAGMAGADAGEFATEEEIARVLNKFG